MDNERHMNDLLNRAVATIEPRTDVLVARGLARGRTLRRRRRVAQVATGTALAAMIAGITVAVWPSPRPIAESPATGHAAHQPVQQAAATVTMTPQVLLRTVLDLLPDKVDTSRYTGRSSPGWVGAEFVYDDGHGAAEVDTSMGFTQDGVDGAQPPCTPGDPNLSGTCTVLADGSHLSVTKGPEYSQGHQPYNATEWNVDLVRVDGVEVSVTEWNSAQAKDQPTTRVDPPLSIAELTAIARSQQWTVEVSKTDADKSAGLFTPDPPDASANTPAVPKKCALLLKAGELAKAKKCAVHTQGSQADRTKAAKIAAGH